MNDPVGPDGAAENEAIRAPSDAPHIGRTNEGEWGRVAFGSNRSPEPSIGSGRESGGEER